MVETIRLVGILAGESNQNPRFLNGEMRPPSTVVGRWVVGVAITSEARLQLPSPLQLEGKKDVDGKTAE